MLHVCLYSQKGENEELPDNLKEIFGNKSGDTSTISDHSAQSSISEDYPDFLGDSSIPNEELTRVLGLLSEEQAKSQALQEKVTSMEKQLSKSKDVEKELEKAKSKVSELNRRFEDATRAYEQEKRVSLTVATANESPKVHVLSIAMLKLPVNFVRLSFLFIGQRAKGGKDN